MDFHTKFNIGDTVYVKNPKTDFVIKGVINAVYVQQNEFQHQHTTTYFSTVEYNELLSAEENTFATFEEAHQYTYPDHYVSFVVCEKEETIKVKEG